MTAASEAASLDSMSTNDSSTTESCAREQLDRPLLRLHHAQMAHTGSGSGSAVSEKEPDQVEQRGIAWPNKVTHGCGSAAGEQTA